MLANTRFRNYALVALPCVVFIYVLHRSANRDGGVIESFHHYTHKLVDLGTIETVQDYTHKLSEALPWNPLWKPKANPPSIDPTHTTTSSNPTTTTDASLSGATSHLGATLSWQHDDPSQPPIPELAHLQDLCHETNWTQGLWLQCTSYCGHSKTTWCGGLNNARNRYEICLRMAIDAGAGLIVPLISPRGVGTADVSVYGQDTCADDWFDLGYTARTMRANCPQLELRQICPDTANRLVELAPPPETDVVLRTPYRGYVESPFAAGEFFEEIILPTLQEASRINESSGELVDDTTIIEFGDSFVAWNFGRSDELDTVRKDLYKAVRFRSSLHEIGETIRDSQQLQHGSYIAVHLRGEGDWPAMWGSAAEQMEMYMEEMGRIRATDEGRNVSAVFVSSGEQEVIGVFRDMLQPLGYTVHDKWTILENFPDELDLVQEADFDSKGIVDNVVLIGGMYFMGIWMSTFSQNVAFARTIDDNEDFLNSVIFHNGVKQSDNSWKFAEPLSLQGDNYTKIIVRDGLGFTTQAP